MRPLIFAAALMTGLIWSQPGQAVTGNELHERCSKGANSPENLLCDGYVQGVFDLIFETQPFSKYMCAPPGSTYGQAIDVVKKWLKENPEMRHYTASLLIGMAFTKAWPCPKKKP